MKDTNSSVEDKKIMSHKKKSTKYFQSWQKTEN